MDGYVRLISSNGNINEKQSPGLSDGNGWHVDTTNSETIVTTRFRMFQNVSECFKTFKYVSKRLRMFQNV